MKPANLPVIGVINAPEDGAHVKNFKLHSFHLSASEYNQWKGYEFKYLNLGEAGTDAAQEAEQILNQCMLVIVLLSVDVMANDALYALVEKAIQVAKQRGIESVGIQLRADFGCERDLWKRIGYIFTYKQKPVVETKDSDEAWSGVVQQLRQHVLPMR